MTEREAYIALNMMEKIGPVGVRSLVAQLGSARAIFDVGGDELMRASRVGREVAGSIVAQRTTLDWQGELERAEAKGARIVTQIDEEYPASLLAIHDPPLALYVWGSLESRDKHAVAVVGARRPTHYGRETAEKLSFQLAKAGFTVISGLARGIDTAAHQGALKAKGRTVAVIGSGLDCIYPACNRELALAIGSEGAVITEFPLQKQPDKTTFPMRNRIVSGLSMGVIVVEAGLKSGALITAKQALDQGRSVFAVPGRIDSFASQGCHQILKEGARLVTHVDDILAEFEFLIPPGPESGAMDKRPTPDLSEEEQSLLGLLAEGERDVDALIRGSGLAAAKVNALLIGLEMKRTVRMLPGRVVEMRK